VLLPYLLLSLTIPSFEDIIIVWKEWKVKRGEKGRLCADVVYLCSLHLYHYSLIIIDSGLAQ